MWPSAGLAEDIEFVVFDIFENSVDGEVVEHFHLHVGAEALAQLVDVDMAFAEAGNIFGFADVFELFGHFVGVVGRSEFYFDHGFEIAGFVVANVHVL